MTNSLSRNSKSFKEENLAILNFLIEESYRTILEH
jgi:hypothetical protein